MDLNMKWIMGGIIVGVLFSILGVFKVLEFRSRRRMQTLRCPECGGSFVIPGLGVIKRWIEFDVETARRNAQAFGEADARRGCRSHEEGNSLMRELKLYIVHGLLHLHGFDDQTRTAAHRMKAAQEKILRNCTGAQ